MAYLPSAPDLRDLYRPRSGMTLRRLNVLLKALPDEARAILRESLEGAERRGKVARLRARQAAFEKRNRELLEREAAS